MAAPRFILDKPHFQRLGGRCLCRRPQREGVSIPSLRKPLRVAAGFLRDTSGPSQATNPILQCCSEVSALDASSAARCLLLDTHFSALPEMGPSCSVLTWALVSVRMKSSSSSCSHDCVF